MITVIEIEKTCAACPAQWEGKTDDGRFIYVRFRWGHLCVEIGSSPDKAVDGESLFEWDDVDGWNGFMGYEELQRLTAGVMSLPATDGSLAESRKQWVLKSLEGMGAILN